MANTNPAAADREIELKLTIDPADASAFRALALLREKCTGRPKQADVFNVYFDTPGLALKHHAMALRLRKTGGKWLQTLKTAGTAAGGFHQRGEWEYPLRAPQLDLALFRETPLATLAQGKALHLTLKPVFTIAFHRTTWRMEVAAGDRVEVALDEGVIRCGDREAVISEVEIELRDGSAAAVFDLAIALARQVSLRPAALSKAERGYRLRNPESPAPRRAGSLELKRNWSPVAAMRTIVAACLGHFDGNVEGALTGDDPEYNHQLRVALRRLRSAMRIFRPEHAAHLSAELKWLTGALGDARDWDVLMMKTLPELLDGFGDAGLAGKLNAAGTRRRAQARESARAALASARESLLVLTLGRWIAVPGEPVLPPPVANAGGATGAPAAQDLTRFASRKIRRRHRRLLRATGTLADLSADARHRVRIDAKRLRYALDFFAGLFDARRVAPYLKRLGRIQDLLGETNDDEIAMHLIGSLQPGEQFIAFARSRLATRTRSNLAAADRLIGKLKKARRFWIVRE